MNLLGDLIARFSSHDPEGFFAGLERKIVADLFHAAGQTNPNIAALDGGRLRALESCLADGSSGRRAAKDPEVFLAINRLMYASTAEATQRALELLELHLALRSPAQLSELPDGYYRLGHSHGRLLRAEAGSAVDVADVAIGSPWGSLVYLPAEGLFRDILPDDLYPRVPVTLDRSGMFDSLAAALARLDRFAGAAMPDFREAVRTIVILPPSAAPNASFSWRLNYLGAIFVDVRSATHRLAEALLHEYMHIRLWQWWAYEDLPGMPPVDAMIMSPVTGSRRSARIMLQALVIYRAALELHDAALTSGDDSSGLLERREQLVAGVGKLADQLRGLITPGSRVAAMVDHVTAS